MDLEHDVVALRLRYSATMACDVILKALYPALWELRDNISRDSHEAHLKGATGVRTLSPHCLQVCW